MQVTRVSELEFDSIVEATENPSEATPLMKEIISLSLESEWKVKKRK